MKNLCVRDFVAEMRILGSRSNIFTKRLFAVSIIFKILRGSTFFWDFGIFLMGEVDIACFILIDHFIVGLASERRFAQKPEKKLQYFLWKFQEMIKSSKIKKIMVLWELWW